MEKYGTLPDRFTKAWWEHIWFYYRTRILIIAFAVGVIVFTCVECATQPKYDATITYVGVVQYTDTDFKKITEELSAISKDLDKNGESSVRVQAMTVAKDNTAGAMSEYDSAMHTKIAMEFQTGDSHIFLLDKQELNRLLERQSYEDIFVPLEEWIGDISVEDTVDRKGIAYAVNLQDNPFFADGGIKTDDLFLVMRQMRTKDKAKEKELANYENSIELARYILAR